MGVSRRKSCVGSQRIGPRNIPPGPRGEKRISDVIGGVVVVPTTLETVQRALENAGVEFIPHGVRRRIADADREARFHELRAVAKASAAQLRGHDIMTEADLYDEDGLPG
jgi:hypothetical protein